MFKVFNEKKSLLIEVLYAVNENILSLMLIRVGRYLKNYLTIIVKEIITIFDNIAINAIKTMTTFFNFN
jgi:hypothetical protein